jgi:EpsI family protein
MNTAMPSEALRQQRFVPLLQGTALLLTWFAFYYSVIRSLVQEWYEHENFSYGFLIPFIVLYLVWERRAVLKNSVSPPGASAAVVFLGAILFGVAGKVFGEPLVSRLSLVVALIGMVQLIWGVSCVKALAFPLGYLFLMVPPPYVIVKEVSYHLRMFDAQAATYLVQAVGVPVYQDAYFMHLPDITLEVADVCSGIASLFAMMALGTIYVYNLPTRLGAKAIVFAGAFICPLIANLFRLFLVTVSVYYYGPVMLGAFFHSFTGTFTFVLSLLMFLWLGETARRKYPQPAREAGAGQDVRAVISRSRQGSGVDFPVLVSIAAAALVLIALHGPLLSPAGEVSVALGQIPVTLGSFTATPGEEKVEGAYADRRAEKSISRQYASAEPSVELFVGYNSHQFDDYRLQSPKLVFPNNWEYASLEDLQLPLPGGDKIDAAELLTKKNEEKRLVLFWYQLHGRAYASDLRNRIELMKSLVVRGSTDGAVVRLATPVARFESLDHARARLVSFAQNLYPELVRVLPQ